MRRTKMATKETPREIAIQIRREVADFKKEHAIFPPFLKT